MSTQVMSIAKRACRHSILAVAMRDLSESFSAYKSTQFQHSHIDSIRTENAILLQELNILVDTVESFVTWVFTLQLSDRTGYTTELKSVVNSQCISFRMLLGVSDMINITLSHKNQLEMIIMLYCDEQLENDKTELQTYFEEDVRADESDVVTTSDYETSTSTPSEVSDIIPLSSACDLTSQSLDTVANSQLTNFVDNAGSMLVLDLFGEIPPLDDFLFE